MTAFASLAWMVATWFIVRYLLRIKYRDLRVAVTGLPSAGKTVLSVALFDALMGDRKDGVSFTGQTKTVMSVYQAIRGISADVWPASTTRDVVNRYEGKVHYRRARVVLDLEWGDSAGEYWAEFPDPEKRDADYLSYVASADAVAHVIPVDWITNQGSPGEGSPYNVVNDIADLQLAARLARPLSPGGKSLPLLVAFTKMDLVGAGSAPWLFRLFTGAQLADEAKVLAELDGPTASAIRDVANRLQERLEGQFATVTFTFSAIQPALEARLVDEEVSKWMLEASRFAAMRSRRQRMVL